MKVRLAKDELYPVYWEDASEFSKEYEIPDNIWLNYKVSLDDFLNARDRLHDYFEKE